VITPHILSPRFAVQVRVAGVRWARTGHRPNGPSSSRSEILSRVAPEIAKWLPAGNALALTSVGSAA